MTTPPPKRAHLRALRRPAVVLILLTPVAIIAVSALVGAVRAWQWNRTVTAVEAELAAHTSAEPWAFNLPEFSFDDVGMVRAGYRERLDGREKLRVRGELRAFASDTQDVRDKTIAAMRDSGVWPGAVTRPPEVFVPLSEGDGQRLAELDAMLAVHTADALVRNDTATYVTVFETRAAIVNICERSARFAIHHGVHERILSRLASDLTDALGRMPFTDAHLQRLDTALGAPVNQEVLARVLLQGALAYCEATSPSNTAHATVRALKQRAPLTTQNPGRRNELAWNVISECVLHYFPLIQQHDATKHSVMEVATRMAEMVKQGPRYADIRMKLASHEDRYIAARNKLGSYRGRRGNLEILPVDPSPEKLERILNLAITTGEARVRVALARWWLAHKTYPAQLSELVPTYLKEVPHTIQRAWDYRPDGDGYWLNPRNINPVELRRFPPKRDLEPYFATGILGEDEGQ